MRPKLKICGITSLQDARVCSGAGVDYLGFIQFSESPRYVPPDTAKEIVGWTVGPEPVGVFVNTTAEEVIATSKAAGFTHAQLHGHASPEDCSAVREAGLKVIKSFSVLHDASSEQVRAIIAPYEGHIDHVLLDTHHTSLWGGTGESFNWRLARELTTDFSLFLAGGINAENVAEAVRIRPFAIDLSSSVEESPGRKDFEKLFAFLDAFENATEVAL